MREDKYPAFVEYNMEKYIPPSEKYSVRNLSKNSGSSRVSHLSNARRMQRLIDDSNSKYSVSIKSSTYRASNVRESYFSLIKFLVQWVHESRHL